MNEFFGYVWLPLIPTIVLLVGGTLLIIRRDLGPVRDAATWARQIRPGQSSDPFWHKDLPASIEDLSEAVNRAIARLNNELENEKRRTPCGHLSRSLWRGWTVWKTTQPWSCSGPASKRCPAQ